MATHGAATRGSPSGRSSTARRCCSNWDVLAPSMVQWPLLCGRIASSLTTRPARCQEQLHREQPGDAELAGEFQRDPLRRQRHGRPASPGAGASTSWQTPPRWTVCTTGYAAPWPYGERATSAASSASKRDMLLGEHRDRVGQHRGRLGGRPAHPDPAPVVAAADRLEHDRPAPVRGPRGHPGQVASPARTGGRARPARAAAPASPACPGCTGARRRRAGPAALRRGLLQRGQVRTGHVLVVEGHHVAADGRTRAGRRVGCSPRSSRRRRPARRCRPAEAASTRNPIPRPIAAWQVIRASCPAPTMPTTGGWRAPVRLIGHPRSLRGQPAARAPPGSGRRPSDTNWALRQRGSTLNTQLGRVRQVHAVLRAAIRGDGRCGGRPRRRPGQPPRP